MIMKMFMFSDRRIDVLSCVAQFRSKLPAYLLYLGRVRGHTSEVKNHPRSYDSMFSRTRVLRL